MCLVHQSITTKMKILIVAFFLFGASFAQGPKRQDFNYDEQEQQQNYQPRQQPSQPQYQEPRQRSSESTTFIPIIRFDKEQGNDGSYKAAWETGNNIIAQEEGYTKDLGPDPDSKDGGTLSAQVQQGSYTYTSPDGTVITVNYIADETGFHPTGDHLPTPPPVSPEVQKGLDLIYAGIRQQQEADAREAKQQPQQQANRNEIPQDYNGQYRQ